MIKRLPIIMLLLVMSYLNFGQNNPVLLSASQFEKYQQIQLAEIEGWMFHKGYDTSWAAINLDMNGWKEFKLVELSTKLADKDGRIEGWFRIKVQLDSSFNGLPLGISRQLWAATDIYVDEVLKQSFGNTGNPYKPYNPTLKYSKPLELTPGKSHLIAIHFVHYESLITPRELRLQTKYLRNLIALTGPEYNEHITSLIKKSYIIGSLTISISCLLFFLFLLLLFLNPSQKIFQLVSTLTFFVLLASIGSNYTLLFNTSYQLDKIIFLFTNSISLPAMHVLTLLVTEWVLKKKISWITLFILALMPFASVLGHLFNISWPFGLLNTFMLGYFAYLVFTSRKQIKKEEWIVVIAMIVLTLSALLFVIIHKYFLDSFFEYEQLIKTIVLLGAPIILLVYVSLSYKEIIAEREQEAKKVIQITEEKKAILERQNVILEEQVTQRTQELKKSLENLKSTQSQLIHTEKMASLGELTAGIAHEIQNPLNFVKNFSEVNAELIEELKEEIVNGDTEEIKAIADDIAENEEKIIHHGKRADAIVKGMLQHSRTSTNEKELTDINALADEYLRLAYHGLRAKDNSFNSDFRIELDKSLPKINVVPQDFGRVMLNLINNAFYAVSSKASATEDRNYKPMVLVSTKKIENHIEVRVKDNGNGIPADVKDKIFQPFFTTKPTGEGTGLGLSLSYDIITKGHNGELKVETQKGEGTEFIVRIPIDTI